MPTYRTLRCANAGLYAAATIMVVAAAIYVLCSKETLWQQMAAVLGAVATPVWAAHYILLRFTVDARGITRRSLLGSITLCWAELTDAQLKETQGQGTESCTICLQAGEKSMRISSDLLPLEEVQELAKELRECGILH